MIDLGIIQSFSYLTEQSTVGLLLLLWYTILFEVPRYTGAFLSFGLFMALRHFLSGRKPVCTPASNTAGRSARQPSVSIIVAGHNEESAIERCVLSLREQTLESFEVVIVSDGSSDRMVDVATDLVRRGLANKVLQTDLRCGKSAAGNLAERYASGDIIIIVDCDCSYDRFSMERIIQPLLDDPRVGAVAGDIAPRNGSRNFVTAFQQIEYMVSISLGKRIEDMFNRVVCASGAFGAFRKEALASVGSMDVGGGEDIDLTIRLRCRGWKIRFAHDAICYTDVPHTLFAFIRQRLRWERDAVRVRFRKHRRLMNPCAKGFSAIEAIHQYDFLLFHVFAAIVFPLYLLWLFSLYGVFALSILMAVQLALVGLDVAAFLTAIGVTKRWDNLAYLPFVFLYGMFNAYVMRWVRLWGYIEEWFFDASRKDNYVPPRVRHARKW